jgi:hypothetical protein
VHDPSRDTRSREEEVAMGWANCGTDSEDRPIGYAFDAVCDQTGCDNRIDRGLAYACGDMHGDLEYACEKYFCEEHLQGFIVVDCIANVEGVCVCSECFQLWEKEHFLECVKCRKANGIVGECEMCQLSGKKSWYRGRRGNGVTYFECDACPHIEVFPDEED